jgi:hypothetical protein
MWVLRAVLRDGFVFVCLLWYSGVAWCGVVWRGAVWWCVVVCMV